MGCLADSFPFLSTRSLFPANYHAHRFRGADAQGRCRWGLRARCQLPRPLPVTALDRHGRADPANVFGRLHRDEVGVSFCRKKLWAKDKRLSRGCDPPSEALISRFAFLQGCARTCVQVVYRNYRWFEAGSQGLFVDQVINWGGKPHPRSTLWRAFRRPLSTGGEGEETFLHRVGRGQIPGQKTMTTS